MIGLIYFIVIILANTVGAVSGMGGGVIIKPIFDFIGAHDVASISFYSAVAVFTMSLVSTYRQVKNGVHIDGKQTVSLALGSILGGYLGNALFSFIQSQYQSESLTQGVQIILTCLTLIFAFFYSKHSGYSLQLKGLGYYLLCGLILGTLASLLGIGGGPINVSLLMLMFAMPIKQATVYSICTIFFSQLSKIVTIGLTTGYGGYDMTILLYVIPAAILGGFIGARLSKILSAERVALIFQLVIILVLLISVYNGIQLL
ncbi:sulfite exporter TauE/SafE family protein [Streptococcus moroccensis]|uniref:Probable membrane transporter protein n=1 Tax=Streptococcus moroccensis TaxID=1451356 RepID=A0ABT9YQ43_9STRE|nr:sulfite exporter TauE/SafE family protein [Streptococcus moroccensis]MDQ0222121.1 putative membrane protein YfcA [Streptococcus moroccensis]